MATVYRARDPQVGRDVAIKVMHGFFAGRAEIEARFRREANAVAAIRHPSILALYDFVPPAGEEPGYIVSELIEGPGLRQLIEHRGGRLLPEVAAMIVLRVAEALGAAHAAGIVHRDVKPDNVLIDRSGDHARVVLTDFGVAHVGGLDTMTATGAVLGSPAYMSPEQARGDDVGSASDVFSLGVLLYQLCTGHLPFSGRDPLSVITAILRGEYLRPAKLEARLGPQWEQVITRCLARDPGARFSDGGGVARALQGLLGSAGVTDEQATLRRYLTDPDAFERDTSPEIARRALAAAEEARRRRQIPRALSELGRALAYAPNDPQARALLARLGSGHASGWIRAGVVAAAVTAAALIIVTVRKPPAHQAPGGVSASSEVSVIPHAARTQGSDAPKSADHLPPETAPQKIETPFSTTPAARSRRRPRANTKASVGDAGDHLGENRGEDRGENRGGPPTTGNPLGQPTIPAVSAVRGLPAEPAEPAEPAAPGVPMVEGSSVELRASHGFCEPSLDDHPPSLRASYNDLAPGPHEIYCTLPQGGGKVHVASYDLRPGKRSSLIIVVGTDGRPVLGRRPE
jgi:serine/threonine-protein kinase